MYLIGKAIVLICLVINLNIKMGLPGFALKQIAQSCTGDLPRSKQNVSQADVIATRLQAHIKIPITTK